MLVGYLYFASWLFPVKLRRVLHIQIFLCHVCRQLHHLLILEIGSIRKEDVDIRNILSLGIREIHEGKVVDIHRGDESAHILQLLLIEIAQLDIVVAHRYGHLLLPILVASLRERHKKKAWAFINMDESTKPNIIINFLVISFTFYVQSYEIITRPKSRK